MVLAALLLLSSSADWEPARRDIRIYCKNEPKCVANNTRELGSFVTMLAGFDDKASARRCMVSAKRGRFIDWTIATPCMRNAVKGKRLPGPTKGR